MKLGSWLRIAFLLAVIAGAALWLPMPEKVTATASAECPPAADGKRVLFIGNSLTYVNDVPFLTRCLSSPSSFQTESVVRGGATLSQHWAEGAAREMMRVRKFDYVVLQENSQGVIMDPPAAQHALASFVDKIRENGAKPILYLPWHRTDVARARSEENNATLASWAAASTVDVANVGEAFNRAEQRFPQIALRSADGIHAALPGSYLAAAVLVAVMAGKEPRPYPALLRRREALVDLVAQRPLLGVPSDYPQAAADIAWEVVYAGRSP